MIENVRKYPVHTVIAISFYYLVGIIGLINEQFQSLFKALVPYTLLFSLYFLLLFHEGSKVKIYVTAMIIILLSFLVEAIGVNTGVIFGHYVYGPTLGIKLWNTPLMIGVNWLLLIYSCWVLTGLFTGNRLLKYLFASMLMVIYDIALEPVAMMNYTGWFLTSMILFIILDLGVGNIKNKIAPALFIIQFIFFLALNIIFYLS
jgi:bisanhydrobacterioruberin hydratase